MNIKISYPKIANQYSFISNLCQWNELVCVPRRKKEWIRKTGSLSQEEENLLKEFGRIFQKSKTNLEPIFLFEDDKKIWLVLSKKIGLARAKKIKLIFGAFKGRFNKIWSENREKLKKIKKNFISRKSEINDNLKTIENLCGLKKKRLPEKIELKLLLSGAGEDCQGWSFKEKVILECSGWPAKKINYLIDNIFIHECFHILLKKNKKLFAVLKLVIDKNRYLLKKTEFAKWTPKIVFEEILISSFLPEGCLGEKSSGIDSRKAARKELAKKKIDSFSRLRNFCALRLYDSAKEYCGKNKPLDKSYFEKVAECFKVFLQIKKG